MPEKFLKSGFMSFLAGIAVIFIYFWISNYKVGGDIYGKISVLNILFSVLFAISCCIAAFFYGKNKNKSGFIGLLCIFAPYYISLLLLGPTPPADLPTYIFIPLLLIFFSYATVFSPFLTGPNAIFYIPVFLIFLIIISWRIGFIKGGHKRVNKTNS